jgi:MerR family copper efflux transcriptional regulator
MVLGSDSDVREVTPACQGRVVTMSSEALLRIGEVASRSEVSRRTVDYYTGLGLLTPVRRSGGNFRLYQPRDVQRIAAIRQLEAQGFRLDEIAHLLTGGGAEDHTHCSAGSKDPCPADPSALKEHLTSLDAQVRALHDLPEVADGGNRSVLTTLVARAQLLIASALVLSEDVLPGSGLLPPL